MPFVLRFFAVLAALVLIFSVLWDAFETIILPRRVRRRIRLTRMFYRFTWLPWSSFARKHIKPEGRRETDQTYRQHARPLLGPESRRHEEGEKIERDADQKGLDRHEQCGGSRHEEEEEGELDATHQGARDMEQDRHEQCGSALRMEGRDSEIHGRGAAA